MKIINKIKEKIELTNLAILDFGHTIEDSFKASLIIIHPETERKVFTDEELPKSESLEDHFGLPVILSKAIKVDEIIIGV